MNYLSFYGRIFFEFDHEPFSSFSNSIPWLHWKSFQIPSVATDSSWLVCGFFIGFFRPSFDDTCWWWRNNQLKQRYMKFNKNNENTRWYCWWTKSCIGSLSRYLQGSNHPRRCRISSINSISMSTGMGPRTSETSTRKVALMSCGTFPLDVPLEVRKKVRIGGL